MNTESREFYKQQAVAKLNNKTDNIKLNDIEYHACVDTLESKIGELHLDEQQTRLLHCAMGLCTEAGELMDQLKRAFFYKKPIDVVNVIEELGDSLFYLVVGLDVYDKTLGDCQTVNMHKLFDRYKEKFSFDKALNRNLESERAVLEGKVSS